MTCGICCSVTFSEVDDDRGRRSLIDGLGMMLIATTADALRTILAQVSIQQLAFMDSLYWCCPAMAAIGLLLSSFLEVPHMLPLLAARSLPEGLPLALAGSFTL